MPRAVTRVGEQFGHKNEDLRLRTSYNEHLRKKSPQRKEVLEVLKSPSISRVTY